MATVSDLETSVVELLAKFESVGNKRWLTIKGAAKHVSLSVESLRRFVAEGKLTSYYPTPGKILIDCRELDAFIASSNRKSGRRKNSRKKVTS